MKAIHTSSRLILATLVAALIGGLVVTQSSHAKQGATDPIPGTSKGTVKSGGGSGGGSTPAPTPAPTPGPPPAPAPQPLVTATLNFIAAGPINGVVPVCTGSYHIDPYYPTLSLMTVDVLTSSMNVPDGSIYYITVYGTGGTLYPFTSNQILVTGFSGACSHSVYVTPGTVITGVVISDVFGNAILAGN